MYVIGYGIGRFWVESLRIDRADEIAGLRVNQWVALIAVVAGSVLLAWMWRHPIAEPTVEASEPSVDPDESGTDCEHSAGEPRA
jgi:prolipoprotein diacylglyceryltransferase